MINKNERMTAKITVPIIWEAFKDVNSVYCFYSIEEDDIHGFINIMDDEEIDVSAIQVLILYNLNNDNENTYKNLEIDEYTFETSSFNRITLYVRCKMEWNIIYLTWWESTNISVKKKNKW